MKFCHGMRLAIVGSRTFSDYVLLKAAIASYYNWPGCVSEIVSGGAAGAVGQTFR